MLARDAPKPANAETLNGLREKDLGKIDLVAIPKQRHLQAAIPAAVPGSEKCCVNGVIARTPSTALVNQTPCIECLIEKLTDSPAHFLVQSPPIVITVTPDIIAGRFSACLAGGDVIIASSRQPFVDAARALIKLGHDPNSMFEMWNPGATEFALRAPVGVAAKLTVEESAHGPVFRRYRMASPSAVDAPRIARNTVR